MTALLRMLICVRLYGNRKMFCKDRCDRFHRKLADR
jgi:hypothetical protein